MYRPLAARTANVAKSMARQCALAYQIILEVRLAVGQSVLSAQSVPWTRLVSTRNVLILARVSVDKMLTVVSIITVPFALVPLVTPATPSADATPYLVRSTYPNYCR